MVNIPPLPPLLCSTPPPIDFGEDDEDVDVLPPSLGGIDDDFGDFLAEDDSKTNEPLPSPRPPSVCDLPKISSYDGFVAADEKNLSNHIRTSASPATDDKTNKDYKNSTRANLTEALNFNVRNTCSEIKSVLQDEIKSLVVGPETDKITRSENLYKTSEILEMNLNKCVSSNADVYSVDKNNSITCSLSKNVKNLKIEALNAETKCDSNKTNICCTENMVSIEDIEDDLSDDELYSPKISKNFVETDNLDDYFKIEIKTLNISANEIKLDAKNVDSKIESASLENENDNEFNSLSSNTFMQNKFDTPPPLPDDANSIDYDDDFGDFVDFQETHFINDTVPVNDINIQPHNDFQLKDSAKHNATEGYIITNKINNNEDNINESEYEDRLNDSEMLNKEFNNLSSNSQGEESDKFQARHDAISKYNSLDLQAISQETSTGQPATADKMCENIVAVNENQKPLEQLCHKDYRFDNLNAASEINDKDDHGNFAEYSSPPSDCENTNVKAIKYMEDPTKYSNDFSNDGDDFADFESHKVTKADIKSSSYDEYKEDDVVGANADDDDDDFGDFNTAEPITTAVSSPTLTKTSQNTTRGAPALPSNHLNERISKILQLMFSSTINPEGKTADEPKPNKIQDIPFTSIDAAKALEYQWLISDTRHSFIRSLGIDSKNILFGDNWNPLVPRFAANLSFNPLKPIKPVQSSNSTGDSGSMLEPISNNNSETNQTLAISGKTKKETLDLDWKSSRYTEKTIDAFKDNTFTPASTSMPYISNEMSTEPESLSIFENRLDNEQKFSKTLPISEMESVTTATMDAELPTTEIELEENVKNTRNVNEVVVASTFTGSFKETHIYTPPRTSDFESKHAIAALSTSLSSPAKTPPIDFDYEKAAMGVIIDETVVKKEYRDVEYKPPFTMESLSKSTTCKVEMFGTNSYVNTNLNILSSTDIKVVADDEKEANDDFSEFQSVSSDVALSEAASIPKSTKPLDVPKTTTVSHGGMILSPAILLPQAISIKSHKPKIEWGDSTATINPEELARIEELFPEPRSLKSSNGSNSSQKSTPTHQLVSTPSISATVANKELEGNVNSITDDDEDWSDFVSVTVTNNVSAYKTTSSNNNILTNSPAGSPFQQRSPVIQRMPPTTQNNSNNDDEWSDFVSGAPPSQQSTAYRVPQFNSGAWQNANFYNNPLSMYYKGPLNITSAATTHSAQKYLYNNNNYNISQQPYQIANSMPATMLANNQQAPNSAYQQQIHVMQNFSTAPVPTPERLSAAASAAKNNQFQSIGSAKIAPSIALIPDLGFVAPAIPTHTSFINSLPKPSINMKK